MFVRRSAALLAASILLISAVPQTAAARSTVAPASPFPVTVTDDHGDTIHLKKAPTRIVSLDPRDTESLFAIGDEKLVVGDGSQYVEGAEGIDRTFKYPSEWPSPWGRDYPVRAKKLTHIEGGCCGTDFNLETIVSLRPDIVFAPYSQTEVPVFDKLRNLGIKVVELDPSNLKGIERDITISGRITGHRTQAAKVVATIKSQVAKLKAKVKKAKSAPRVFYEIDASNPAAVFTAGRGTFIDEAIAIARGKNVADAASSCSSTLCYPQFSLEALVRLDPQVVILGDAAYGVKVDDVRSRTGWETMSAVKSGKIFPFDDEIISRAGPRIAVGIAALARLIHPEVFGTK